MTKNEVMQMALEALTCTGEDDDPGHRCGHCDDYVDRNGLVRAALRERLEQPKGLFIDMIAAHGPEFVEEVRRVGENIEQQAEPVAYCYVKKGSSADALTFDQKPADAVSGTVFPLYITPPQRKPLTDEEISAASKGHMTRNGFARAIEAAHGIKGEA